MPVKLPFALLAAALLHLPAQAQNAAPPGHDAGLARSLGADDRGLRSYVLVLLKTGPNRMPDGAARNAMFASHFANMERLAKEKKLVVAGPLDGVNGMRGVFVFATGSIDEAKALVATDPVIAHGEMIAEYHEFLATAGLMALYDIHTRIRLK